MDLLDKMDKYVRYRGASAFPDDGLLLPLADEYTRPQSISFERSAPSSVNDETGCNTSTLLLTQVDKDQSRIKLCHVKLINVADIVCRQFFNGESDKLDLFLNKEAANLVIFRKYFCILLKIGIIVDEVGYFQLYFTTFIHRLIKQLGDGNLVKSVNSELKETKLFLNVPQPAHLPSTKLSKMKSDTEIHARRQTKDFKISPCCWSCRLIRISDMQPRCRVCSKLSSSSSCIGGLPWIFIRCSIILSRGSFHL